MSNNPLVFRPSAGPEYPRWSETLHDRSHVLIRPIQPQDKDAERAFIEGLSAQARRFRFLGQVRTPSEALIELLTVVDYVHDVAFVAVTPDDGRERIVGVSRYSTDESGLNCECAVTVSDEWQNKGLGTLLMKHLIEVARIRGVRRMVSLDASENVAMNDLARHLGFSSRIDPDNAAQVIHELLL
jgi:GNAT superfamily N-acetyltransferase